MIDEKAMNIALIEYRRHDDFRGAIETYEAAKALASGQACTSTTNDKPVCLSVMGKNERQEFSKPSSEQPVGCRTAFENWRETGVLISGLLGKDWLGEWYADPVTQAAWVAWEAAWSSRPEREVVTQWQPIDTCDRQGFVLMFCENGFFSIDTRVEVGTYEQWHLTATHWMPLPQPPKQSRRR